MDEQKKSNSTNELELNEISKPLSPLQSSQPRQPSRSPSFNENAPIQHGVIESFIKEITENLNQLQLFNDTFNETFNKTLNQNKTSENYVINIEYSANTRVSTQENKLIVFFKSYYDVVNNNKLLCDDKKHSFQIKTHQYSDDTGNHTVVTVNNAQQSHKKLIETAKKSIIQVLNYSRSLIKKIWQSNNKDSLHSDIFKPAAYNYTVSNQTFIKMCGNLIYYHGLLCDLEINTENGTSINELKKQYEKYSQLIAENYIIFNKFLSNPDCDPNLKKRVNYDDDFKKLIERLVSVSKKLQEQQDFLNDYQQQKGEFKVKLQNLTQKGQGNDSLFYRNKPISIMKGGNKYDINDVRMIKQNFTDLFTVSNNLLNKFKNKNKIVSDSKFVAREYSSFFN